MDHIFINKEILLNTAALDRTYSLQANNINSTSKKSASSSQAFASLLAMQMNNALQKGVMESTDASSTSSSSYAALDNYTLPLMLQNSLSDVVSDNSDGKDDTKNLIMMLCLMMCSGSSGDGSDSSSMMMSLLSSLTGTSGTTANSISGSTPAASSIDLTKVTSNLPANAKGSAIVQAALSRLGDPYSKAKRGTGNYVDCSYLAKWAYAQEGITIPSTSVMQAKYCYDKGYTITKDQLQPGDLVFWSKTSCDCGRWNEIHHVGIYAGDGKVVEAKGPAKGVEIDDLWESKNWKIVMYARPQ